MRLSMEGWSVRKSISTQPVHCCPDSQITGGRSGEVTASAIFTPADMGRPRVAATAVQNFMKSLRLMLLNRVSWGYGPLNSISYLPVDVLSGLCIVASQRQQYYKRSGTDSEQQARCVELTAFSVHKPIVTA